MWTPVPTSSFGGWLLFCYLFASATILSPCFLSISSSSLFLFLTPSSSLSVFLQLLMNCSLSFSLLDSSSSLVLSLSLSRSFSFLSLFFFSDKHPFKPVFSSFFIPSDCLWFEYPYSFAKPRPRFMCTCPLSSEKKP